MLLSRISEERRRRIFAALVKAQDDRVGVFRSRVQVAARFGITRCQVERIEEEGLKHEWPPLSDGAIPSDPADTDDAADEPIIVAAA